MTLSSPVAIAQSRRDCSGDIHWKLELSSQLVCLDCQLNPSCKQIIWSKHYCVVEIWQDIQAHICYTTAHKVWFDTFKCLLIASASAKFSALCESRPHLWRSNFLSVVLLIKRSMHCILLRQKMIASKIQIINTANLEKCWKIKESMMTDIITESNINTE